MGGGAGVPPRFEATDGSSHKRVEGSRHAWRDCGAEFERIRLYPDGYDFPGQVSPPRGHRERIAHVHLVR
jgi:hypothetical protein